MFYIINDKPEFAFVEGIGKMYATLSDANTALRLIYKLTRKTLKIYCVSGFASKLIADNEFVFQEAKDERS